MTMTPERLAELDAVMANATAGEWQADGLDIKLADAKKASWGKNEANNVAAIVALHNAYPDLTAHIAALEAGVAELRICNMRYRIALGSIGRPEPLVKPDAIVCGIIARSALDFVDARAALAKASA